MKNLVLTVHRVPSGVSLRDFRVQGGRVTLGRGAACDWVLQDPQRLLSKRHCEIMSQQDRWMITDLSSNGTTLNGRLLPPGVPCELRDGDRLGFGSYEIDARIEGASGTAIDEQTLGTNPYASRPSADVYTGGSSGFGREASPFESVFGERPSERTDIAGLFDRTGGGTEPRSTETLSIIDPFNIALDSSDDPAIADLGKRPGSLPDTVSEFDTPFTPPRPTSMMLPDDWELPLQAEDKPGGLTSADTGFENTPQIPAGFDRVEPPSAPVNPLSPRDESPFDGVPPWQSLPGVPHPDAPRAEAIRVNSPPPSSHQAVPSSGGGGGEGWGAPGPATTAGQPSGEGSARALAAFMRGAGVEGQPAEAPETMLEDMGKAFRAMVAGLRRAMIARAEIKGEFRIDRTMIQPYGNNPLKFAIDDDDAVAALVGVGRRTGVSAAGAIADTLDDIRKHEIAVTRAMEPAAAELLRANGPEAVLARLAYEPGHPLSLFRRAKAWNAYVQSHEQAVRSLGENMDGAFGRAFGRAYEAALRETEEADRRDGRDRDGRDRDARERDARDRKGGWS